MRCFFMLKEAPDLEKLRGFIARCRQSDGGYATRPGLEADPGGTYYATTILRWVRLLGGEPALVETTGFVPLFDGKDLNGWEGDTALWSGRDGRLVGTSPGLKHNDFLSTEREYGDFILKLTFRLADGKGNSGVQFRSDRLPPHEMIGYQADLGDNYWGCLYDESRRKRVLVQASEAALKALRKTRWNEYNVRAMGAKIVLTLNGKKSVDYTEADQGIKREGKIAVQIHAGGPMEVQFKDIWIQPLPRPAADDLDKPGFRLRTVKTEQGERKYSVFLPNGYDGKKSFPVALFLHGSGERGNDGVMGAQVGLGAAIHQNPDDYPLIAVFPQAEKTWKAGSDDAKAALAALDDVLKTYKADRDRVILTGLSMGGSGSWSIAAANPERFVAVVPVCGQGQEENAPILKALPVWAFVGDDDNAKTVLNARRMVEALRDAGGSARETEYRGVGHNSWDRAYNDPALIGWMLARSRR
jgi:acetyl esterase/lipase